MVPEANPRAQHARNSRRGGINSYLRGRGSRSERGPVCACVRARASLALRLPIQCHRHISTEPPPPPHPQLPRLAQPRAGPAPPPPGPPSLSRAPINQPRRCQSSGGSPAPAGRCHCLCSSRPRRGPGSAAAQYPSAARGWERAHPRPGARVAAPPPASDCAPGRSG